jgi:thiol-disulfide isomerase/thioredoxin
MKKTIHLFFTFLLTSLGAVAQDFSVSVKANQVAPGRKIYLEFINGRGQAVKVDSLLPNAQKEVLFKGKVLDQGGFYLLNFYDIPNPQKVLLILEGGEKVQVQAEGINLPEKPGTFTVTGNTPNFTYMNQLLAISKSLENRVAAWNLEIEKTPSSQDRIQKEFIKAQTETLEKIKALIPAMGTNLVALWATNFLPTDTELATLEAVGERFRKVRPTHPQVRPFLENLKRLKGVGVGSEAPEIALNTPTGERLALSSLRGKYVLIDFWASWCGPCRRENPNVIKTYAAYKDKGFEIYGVSLDQDKAAWLKAIETDQLVWKHVSDLQYWNSVAAQAYQVSAIPMTFLLDKEGKIMAKGLRGAALDQYLADLFSDKK